MIIVNQEKNEFVNFDNIMDICVTDCDEDGYGIFAGFIVGRDDNYRILGYYKTEERAKEILEEILNTESWFIRVISMTDADPLKTVNCMMPNDRQFKYFNTYEMPKE